MRLLHKQLIRSALAALLLSNTGCMTMEDIWPSFRRGERLHRPERTAHWQQPQSQQLTSPPIPQQGTVAGSADQVPMHPEVTPLFPDPSDGQVPVPVVEVPSAVPPVPAASPSHVDSVLNECRAQVDQLQVRIAQLEAESDSLRSKLNSSEVAMGALGDGMRRLSGEVDYWRKEVRRLEQKAEQTHAEDMRALDELIEMLDAPKPPGSASETPSKAADAQETAPLPGVDE